MKPPSLEKVVRKLAIALRESDDYAIDQVEALVEAADHIEGRSFDEICTLAEVLTLDLAIRRRDMKYSACPARSCRQCKCIC